MAALADVVRRLHRQAGGITTLGNMAIPEPGETPLATLEREARLVREQAIADVMLHPTLLPPTAAALRELPQLAAAGHTSVKVFMASPVFDQHVAAYLAALRAAREAGILTMSHCEDHALVSDQTQALLSEGRGALHYFAESRPAIAEVVATQRAVAMCEATGAPVYIVHLPCERALRVCEEAQAQGLPVYVETRPMFLHHTRARYRDPDGAQYVIILPLREAHDVP